MTDEVTLKSTDLISRKQLAIDLGNRLRGSPYSEWTLIYWQRNKMGPPITKIGREVLYRASSVEKWLLSQEKAPAA